MIRQTADGVVLSVRVVPRAAKGGIAGTRGNRVLVRLNAPPVDGAANAALVELLAEVLGVPRRAVAIAAGLTSRNKQVRVAGIGPADARSRLGLGP